MMAVSEALMPNLSIFLSRMMPGVFMGRQIKDLVKWLGLSWLVLANRHIQSAVDKKNVISNYWSFYNTNLGVN